MTAASDYLSNVPALSTWWVDTANRLRVVGQSKMSFRVTGKTSKSKAKPALG